MRSRLRISVAAILATSLMLAGCSPAVEEPTVEPKVAPPAISDAGVLRAGVDLDYPPFAGTDKGREAGIDIDVASALATELGLTLETVQVAPSEAATALAEGRADIVLSVPATEDVLTGATFAGGYVSDGPVFYSAAEATETVTLDDVGGRAMGAQTGSAAYWLLTYEFGEDAVMSFSTLREAFEAARDGQIEIIGADGIIGAYIAQDYEGIRYAGQIAPAAQLGVAVAAENTTLEQAVRDALDGLAARGVLETIRAKWAVGLPVLETPPVEELAE